MPRGILATCTARLGPGVDHAHRCATPSRAAYDGEPFVRVLPEGEWPHHAGHRSAPTARTCRSRPTPHAGRAVVVVGDRQPRQGRGRPGRAERQPHPRPAGDRRPHRHWESPRERHRRPPGSGAAGVAAGLKSSRRRRRRAGRQRRPARTPPPACSPATGSRPRRCCGRQQVLAAGELRAVVLNSGGANACTGPGGFQDTHAHRRARGRAARLRRRARSPSARPA